MIHDIMQNRIDNIAIVYIVFRIFTVFVSSNEPIWNARIHCWMAGFVAHFYPSTKKLHNFLPSHLMCIACGMFSKKKSSKTKEFGCVICPNGSLFKYDY
jgi:hypothetical protein